MNCCLLSLHLNTKQTLHIWRKLYENNLDNSENYPLKKITKAETFLSPPPPPSIFFIFSNPVFFIQYINSQIALFYYTQNITIEAIYNMIKYFCSLKPSNT